MALGVSHPSLQFVVDESNRLGFASKLTGAGGGGCAITLITDTHDDSETSEDLKELTLTMRYVALFLIDIQLSCLQYSRSLGFDVFESDLAGDGVLWHSSV